MSYGKLQNKNKSQDKAMLKKLLTTFIVLAATATAWAEGWKVTTEWSSGNEGSVDGQNTYTISVITWSESESMTLADAITAANSEGSYMIRIIGDTFYLNTKNTTYVMKLLQHMVLIME